MKKIMFSIADYPDHRQQIFDEHYSPRNQEYANKWGYEYRTFKRPDQAGRSSPIWGKLMLARKILKEENPDTLLVLDADMVWRRIDEEMTTDKDFRYHVDSANTHCMGNYLIKNTPWSHKFLDELLSDERYERNKNKELWVRWAEQASLYYLLGVPDHSDASFLSLPNYGWLSVDRPGEMVYSLDEMYEHLDVGGPEWNTTLLETEQDSQTERSLFSRFHINPIEEKDCRIRHFAGGQRWRIYDYSV